MADITSALSDFDEWLKKRRQAQVAGMGTIESGDYGAKPYYTEAGGLGEAGPAMNPQQYSRLGSIMNPPIPTEPEYEPIPGPGTAAREEGISAIASGYQGVPAKQMEAASALASEEFSRPDVWSGQRFVPGAAANEGEYNKNWEMASALESAGKPYWKKTKEGYEPVFQPESVLKGKLATYSGGLQAGVKKDLAEVDKLIGEGKHEEAAALVQGALAKLTGVQAAEFPASAKAERGLQGNQGKEASSHSDYWKAKADEAKTTNKSNKEMNSALNKLDLEEQKAKDSFLTRFGIPSGQEGLMFKTDTVTQKAYGDIETGFAQKRQSVLQRYSTGAGVAPAAPLDTATEALKQRAKAGDIKAQQYLSTKGVAWQ